MKLLACVDGGGAHGAKEAGIGVLLIDRDTGELIFSKGLAIGDATNNEAEWSAVYFSMLQAHELGCTDLLIRSDSKLVVNQLNGDWMVHEDHIGEYYNKVQEELGHFDKFKIEWVPRANNKLADGLARRAVNHG